MNPLVHRFVRLIKDSNDINTKEEMMEKVANSFPLVKDGRALYHTDFFAVVFCYSKNKSFSNVVLSLSKLEKYDHIPCFVVLVRQDMDNLIYLINTSFLDKISHSSQCLRLDNIKGSLLGSNIRRDFPEIGLENRPEDFDDLFVYHQGFTWQENLERLVEKTNHIVPRQERASLDDKELNVLFASPNRAKAFVESSDYKILLDDLNTRCAEVKEAIVTASYIDNVNIRGRLIEILITSDPEERARLLQELRNTEQMLPSYDTKNDLGDYVRHFEQSDTYTDIKTKVLYLDSNPKAFNIDKFLKCMAKEKSVFMFFFVGIDKVSIVNTLLCLVYHNVLLESTLLQQHWAGRATRGTAQFSGKCINGLLNAPDFKNTIDCETAKNFIQRLIDR